jgi:hypothetical protein
MLNGSMVRPTTSITISQKLIFLRNLVDNMSRVQLPGSDDMERKEFLEYPFPYYRTVILQFPRICNGICSYLHL